MDIFERGGASASCCALVTKLWVKHLRVQGSGFRA